ncbi:MAG: hypothetical protein K2X27_10745 [Candidatus Obscuribacterales bacterium]|nr:hypothetical protein [Candidatus Obscuribacterales bacterium]
MTELKSNAEAERLEESANRSKYWLRWGPYLSERQWSTVREDYSENGTCWEYFPHEHARSRAYRWGEDGILGISDRQCRLCFSIALWNEKDPILKERLFGLTGPEGNHGEDVKETYFYLDSTPTHSYMKGLYKYPQTEFPYQKLLEENAARGLTKPEFELSDSGAFDHNRYFDVFVEYAKAAPEDLLIEITVFNRSAEAATLHLLPTLWFRNTWSWGCQHEGCTLKPNMQMESPDTVSTRHETLGTYFLSFEKNSEFKSVLFTENHSNFKSLFGGENDSPFVKDAFHRYIIQNEENAVNPRQLGSKCAMHYLLNLAPKESRKIRLRLFENSEIAGDAFSSDFENTFSLRRKEADDFYAGVFKNIRSKEKQLVARQAHAGLLWSKQFYHYIIEDWLKGDPYQPAPSPQREEGRNHEWTHLYARDIISMPDKWEYPWFAAWDLAFHMIPFAQTDPQFAKHQLTLLLREWYMHPNGQLPAYEFNFADVNPPVHAWAAWRVYHITGAKDIKFLESIYHKLLLNFTWWVNRKDIEGNNLFAGGFLGLDNIGVFDRSKALPTGGFLQQADGTAWMAFYSLTMLSISLELAQQNSAYEDMASKFFEHFVFIADAVNELGGSGLWDEEDGFYYDQLKAGGETIRLKTRSLVGLLPLIAVAVLDEEKIAKLPGFFKRMEWFLKYKPELARMSSYCDISKEACFRLLSLPSKERLSKMLSYMLDENEFLSEFGIRSLSRFHKDNPYIFDIGEEQYRVDYSPGESQSNLFGGNSNWRGPIWFPLNYLIIEALERYHSFYGDSFQIECPSGSGNLMNLKEIALELSKRLSSLFLPKKNHARPCHGEDMKYADDENWRELVLFYEYFHGDSGRGMGANHQTGWTALVATMLETCGNLPE